MYTELNEQVKYLKHQALKAFNQIQLSIDVCMLCNTEKTFDRFRKQKRCFIKISEGIQSSDV